jgi:hypothetical protein
MIEVFLFLGLIGIFMEMNQKEYEHQILSKIDGHS